MVDCVFDIDGAIFYQNMEDLLLLQLITLLRIGTTKKFETTSGGVNVTGELQANTLDINGAADISSHLTLHGNLDMQDNDEIRVGTGDDLKIYH